MVQIITKDAKKKEKEGGNKNEERKGKMMGGTYSNVLSDISELLLGFAWYPEATGFQTANLHKSFLHFPPLPTSAIQDLSGKHTQSEGSIVSKSPAGIHR